MTIRHNRVDDIVATIVGVVTEHRAKAIANGILAHYRKPKPAG